MRKWRKDVLTSPEKKSETPPHHQKGKRTPSSLSVWRGRRCSFLGEKKASAAQIDKGGLLLSRRKKKERTASFTEIKEGATPFLGESGKERGRPSILTKGRGLFIGERREEGVDFPSLQDMGRVGKETSQPLSPLPKRGDSLLPRKRNTK